VAEPGNPGITGKLNSAMCTLNGSVKFMPLPLYDHVEGKAIIILEFLRRNCGKPEFLFVEPVATVTVI